MLGLGEPCAKKAKCDQQRIYNEMHSVEVQANATESVFELYAQREAKKSDFQCQWPCGEAPPCKQILSPAREEESFFVCGQDSLAVLLQETARGCACGLQYAFDGSVTKDGHVLRTELCCMNGHRVKWASSSILSSKYTGEINYIVTPVFVSTALSEANKLITNLVI